MHDADAWAEVIHGLVFDDRISGAEMRFALIQKIMYLREIGVEITPDMLGRMIDVEAGRRVPGGGPPKPPAIVTVYYVRVGHLIKIGQAQHLPSRLRAYPPTSVLLATETGARDALERLRLAQFAVSLAHPREWFHPSAELIGHINSLREQPLTAADLAA